MGSDSEIKVTGTPVTYGTGATRNTKEGKGRFDLIPPEPFGDIDQVVKTIDESLINSEISLKNLIEMQNDEGLLYGSALFDSFDKTIVRMIIHEYLPHMWEYQKYKSFSDAFWPLFWKVMKQLAVHFQKGAEIYGERNCQKGIPLWSFKDSGIRHMTQWLNDETDEPHFISAIWNFWMALWTIHQGETISEIETKSDVYKTTDDVIKSYHDVLEGIIGENIALEITDKNSGGEGE